MASLALTLAGCGGDGDSATPGAGTAVTPASASSAGTATSARPGATKQGGDGGSGLCGLFSTDEQSERLGLTVGPGEVGGPMDTQCQWDDASGDGWISIQRVSAEYWSEPIHDKTYKPLPGVGEKAYTSAGLGGEWLAFALKGEDLTNVGMRGGKASREAAAAFLEEVLSRG